jgi:hypothetical protein
MSIGVNNHLMAYQWYVSNNRVFQSFRAESRYGVLVG